MAGSKKVSRRDVLKVGAGVAAPYLIPSGVLAAPGKPGANDRIGIGYIAVGRRAGGLRGMLDRAIRQGGGAEVVAVSDVNTKRMGEFAGKANWKKYQDYRKMLEDKDVDGVIISTPDHWHALNSIHAMQAGKDVYCEKPMTLTIREGRIMVEAARKHKRVFQTGSQQRSMQECRFGCELVRNGRIGKIKLVHGANYPSPLEKPEHPAEPVPEGLDWDMWCGPTKPRPFNAKLYLPRPHPTGWISYRPYSGGEMTGWGAHGLDIIQWALGMDETGPVEVWPEGTGLECKVSFRYANGVVVHLDGRAGGGGGLFEGEKGTVLIDRGKWRTTPEEIGKEPIKADEIHLYKSDDHMLNWLECMRTRKTPICDVETGHRSTTMCHLGNIARWTGRKLRWDPKAEKFVGDDEANALIDRPRRAPYTLPETV
ncbi:MAG: Gfo/Idh/MocA family oxidoreductase [Phycisphaerae bacterium]|nr:Gfo/Idh/MocA family oxidoreductase [Phycisphaerae bacterium]